MKKLCIAVVVLLCASCASHKGSEISAKRAGKLGQQHASALTLAALYYCKNKMWPNNLQEIQKYQSENNIKLGVPTEWNWLLSNEVTYSNSPSYLLTSISNIGNSKPAVIMSGQSIPICNGGENELVGAYLNMDLGE